MRPSSTYFALRPQKSYKVEEVEEPLGGRSPSHFGSTTRRRLGSGAHIHFATPPCLEQAPLRDLEWLYIPSLHWAIAPAGSWFSDTPDPAVAILREAGAAAGAAFGIATGFVAVWCEAVETLHSCLFALPGLVQS